MDFLRIGIKGRIFAGFGLLIALALALALFGVWALSSIQSEMGRMSRLSDNRVRALELNRELGVMRQAAQNFHQTASEVDLKQGTEAATKAIELLRPAGRGSFS